MDVEEQLYCFPCIVPVYPDDPPKRGMVESPLPLEHTQVSARIAGFAAAVTVEQQFRNPFDRPVDLEYLFPLHHDAAVTGFEFKVGGRTITSSLQESKQATRRFEQARDAGKRAVLVSQRLPNLFGINLANVQPGENIEAVLHYQQRVDLVEDHAEFVFPMGLTPKYQNLGQPDPMPGVKVHHAVTLRKEEVGDVSIEVEVIPGAAISGMQSPSHAISVEETQPGRFAVELDGACLPDHDLVLRWQYLPGKIQMPAWVQPGKDARQGSFVVTMVPPSLDSDLQLPPREFIFVVDRSGSMGGEPIAQARNAVKACLRSLEPRDSFAVVAFDDRVEVAVPMTQVSQRAIDEADRMVARLDARGGTEIFPALKAALDMEHTPSKQRLVIFLTDGSVSGERQMLEHLGRHVGETQVFSFGIGPAVNRAFISQIAKIGGGMAEFLGANEDIEQAMLRFQDRVNYPQMSNISIQAANGVIYDLLPERLPNLYSGQVLQICGSYTLDGSHPLGLTVRAERDGQQVEMAIGQLAPCPIEGLVGRLAARSAIDALMEKNTLGIARESATRQAVLAVAVANGLASAYTSFVAVDETGQASRKGAMTVEVSQPLPEGLQMDHLYSMQAPMYSISDIDFDDAMSGIEGFAVQSPSPMRMARSMGYTKNARMSFDEDVSPMTALIQMLRTQRLDGSWNEDVRLTALVCIAFSVQGQCHTRGTYKKQLGKALAWLAAQKASGTLAYWRLAAIYALEIVSQKSTAPNVDAYPNPGKPAVGSSLLEISLIEVMEGLGTRRLEYSDSFSEQEMALVGWD